MILEAKGSPILTGYCLLDKQATLRRLAALRLKVPDEVRLAEKGLCSEPASTRATTLFRRWTADLDPPLLGYRRNNEINVIIAIVGHIIS